MGILTPARATNSGLESKKPTQSRFFYVLIQTSFQMNSQLKIHTYYLPLHGIVLLLSELGELCVCDLCTALDQSQPKISRHLALLRESGLLLDRKQGKWVHYRLSPHIPSWAAKIIEQAWRCEQEKVQVIVRNLARQNCSVDSKNTCS